MNRWLYLLLHSADISSQEWYNHDPASNPFKMTYAHYVVMGGIAADITEYHNVLETITLTTDGVLFLAENGVFCRVRPSDIKDKSKADYIAKVLVCIQVLWLLGLVIERKVAQLPITMLELHTLVHVFCALAMYALWFQKPLSVQCPTSISYGRLEVGMVLFLLELHLAQRDTPSAARWSNANGKPLSGCHKVAGFIASKLAREDQTKRDPAIFLCLTESPENGERLRPPLLSMETVLTEQQAPGSVWSRADSQFADHEISNRSYKPAKGKSIFDVMPGQLLEGSIGFIDRDYVPSDYNYDTLSRYFCWVSISKKDIKRLQLVADAWKRVPSRHRRARNGYEIELLQHRLKMGNLLTCRIPNLNSRLFPTKNGPKSHVGLLIAILPTLYGAAHLLALYGRFPTDLERHLWKGSCCYLSGVSIVAGLIPACLNLRDDIDRDRIGYRHGRRIAERAFAFAAPAIEMMAKFLFKLLVLLVVMVYFVARVFIVVEAFISLRRLPIGAYVLPERNIMANIPHF